MNDSSNMDASYQVSRQKIIFTGDVSVGKTSIINNLLGQKFIDEYEPSIGVDFFTKTIKYKSKLIKFQIWDSAGQEKFRSLIPNYIRGASLVFLVYDISNKSSFDSLPGWIKFIENIESTCIVILGNKTDLEAKRQVKEEDIKNFSENNNNLEYFEISAKDGTGINEMFFKSVAALPVFNLINEGNEKSNTNESNEDNNSKKANSDDIYECLIKENLTEGNKRSDKNNIDGEEGNENESGIGENSDINKGGLMVESNNDNEVGNNQESRIDNDLVVANSLKKRKKCC